MKNEKKAEEDDDSSSISSEAVDTLKLYKNLTKRVQPITYWWYDPFVYNLKSVYIPTLISTVVPYVEVATIGYYY